MMTLRQFSVEPSTITIITSWYLSDLSKAQGKQELFTHQSPQKLKLLREHASTVLDQLHQSMILFGAGRGEALKGFLVDDGIGMNPLCWRLGLALSALYPSGTDEKRWVDGVLARKKGLGF